MLALNARHGALVRFCDPTYELMAAPSLEIAPELLEFPRCGYQRCIVEAFAFNVRDLWAEQKLDRADGFFDMLRAATTRQIPPSA